MLNLTFTIYVPILLEFILYQASVYNFLELCVEGKEKFAQLEHYLLGYMTLFIGHALIIFVKNDFHFMLTTEFITSKHHGQ